MQDNAPGMPLLSPYLRPLMLFVWPAIIALQWFAVVPLAISHDLVWSLPVELPEGGMSVPLARDYFFIVWNLLPFGIVGSLWWAERRVQRVLSVMKAKSPSTDGQAPITGAVRRYARYQVHWALIGLAVVIAALGSWYQFVKVAGWESDGSVTYWWQAQYSLVIFYTRLVVLFFDLLILPFALASLVTLILTVNRLASLFRDHLEPLHIDGCGGAADFGRAAVAFTFIPCMIGLCGLLGILTHGPAAVTHRMGDAMLLLAGAVIGAFAFVMPIFPVHSWLVREKNAVCDGLRKSIESFGPLIRGDHLNALPDNEIEALETRRAQRDQLVSLYELYRGAPSWPFNVTMSARLLATVTGPIIIAGANAARIVLSR